MRYASSLRYAGLLVAAEDCDYSSFPNLGLTCPNCHESVFLVIGSERQEHKREYKDGKVSHVRASIISPHFSHRPDKDKSELEKCELRSARTTQADIARSMSGAKNQMIKLFNRHLWNLLKLCYKLNDFDEAVAFVKDGFKLALKEYPEFAATRYQALVALLVNVFRQQVEGIHKESEEYLNTLIEKSKDSKLVQTEIYTNMLAIWRQNIDRRMHLQTFN